MTRLKIRLSQNLFCAEPRDPRQPARAQHIALLQRGVNWWSRSGIGSSLSSLLLVLLTVSIQGCTSPEGRVSALPEQRSAREADSQRFPQVQWVKYYEALSASAHAKPRTLMLYLTHASCEPCALMEKWTFTDREVVRALEDFIPVRIQADTEIQLVRRFGVQTFPMVIFADIQHGEIDRKGGYRDAEAMLAWLRDIEAGRNTIKALEEQIEESPENPQLLIKQSRNLIEAGEVEQAFTLARKAADVAPGNPDVLALFGLYYLRIEKLEAAEAAVDAALQTEPGNEEAHRLKVLLLLKKGSDAIAAKEFDRALEYFSAALSVDPNNFDALMGLGRIHAETGETEKALREFEMAAAVRPDSPSPHMALGELHQRADDDALAEEEYLKAIAVEPRYEAPYYRLMELYEKTGRRGDLMDTYAKVLPLEPAAAHNEIAWLMATSKHPHIFDPDSAVKHANAAVEADPRPWYIDTLAEAYYAQGVYELAIAVIKEAMATGPKDIDYYQKQFEKFQKAQEQTIVDESKLKD